MRAKLLKIIGVVLCAGMLSGCAIGTPAVATVDTEQTKNESIAGTEGVENGESIAGEDETQPLESEESTEGQTETLTDAPTDEQTQELTDASSEEPTEGLTDTSSEEPTEVPTEEPTEEQTEPPTVPQDPPYLIKVDRVANCVTVYASDENGDYVVPVKHMICSVGTANKTPTGVFAITDQYRWRALFSNAYGQYASRITGHILFHSVPYFSSLEDTLITQTYNDLGTKASMGCVRLKTIDAKWIYENCPPGTVVEIFDGPTTDIPEKPSALYIDPNSPFRGWDPTDPHPGNPWKTVPVTINGVTDLTVECGSEVDLTSHVSALDIDGRSPLAVSVSGTIDINKCGTYIIEYSAVGEIGTTAKVQATITVVPTPETEAPTEPQTEMSIEISTEGSDIAKEEVSTEEL